MKFLTMKLGAFMMFLFGEEYSGGSLISDVAQKEEEQIELGWELVLTSSRKAYLILKIAHLDV